MQYYLEIITCDPSLYTKDHTDLDVSNFMGNSIGTKRDNLKSCSFCLHGLSVVLE